jgi:hypothetical protein
MAHNQQQLIELWDRADRVCEEAHEAIQAIRSQLETSVGLLAERMGHSVDTRDLVARSRALLEKSARLRTL